MTMTESILFCKTRVQMFYLVLFQTLMLGHRIKYKPNINDSVFLTWWNQVC